jgi:hypothetical protein
VEFWKKSGPTRLTEDKIMVWPVPVTLPTLPVNTATDTAVLPGKDPLLPDGRGAIKFDGIKQPRIEEIHPRFPLKINVKYA